MNAFTNPNRAMSAQLAPHMVGATRRDTERLRLPEPKRLHGPHEHAAICPPRARVGGRHRPAYERFDPELTALAEALATNDRKRARDVEPAVAALLWMLGFNTCHLGGTKVLQDGPDILGATPVGNVVVVECTIGTLKADSKMPKLLARTASVREQLSKAGHAHLRVLPVMVTTLPRDEIASELGDAVSNGVYVIAGDDFQEAIGRTLIPPHADQLFTEAEQNVQGISDLQPQQA